MATKQLSYTAAQIDAAIAEINSLIVYISGAIVQLYDGSTAIYPRTKAESVFFDNDTSKTLDEVVEDLQANSGAYDISAANGGTPYVDLAAALGTNGANVPADVRRGGMSIKFIQGSVPNSDNKYVQYRLMKNQWSTTASDWQGVDDVPIAGSNNLVKSNGVYGMTHFVDGEITYNENSSSVQFMGGSIDQQGNRVTTGSANYIYLFPVGIFNRLSSRARIYANSPSLTYAFYTTNTISSTNFISGGDYISSGSTVVRSFDVDIPSNAAYVAVVFRYNDSNRFAATLTKIVKVVDVVSDVDDEPTEGSEKLITSGGVYDAIKDALEIVKEDFYNEDSPSVRYFGGSIDQQGNMVPASSSANYIYMFPTGEHNRLTSRARIYANSPSLTYAFYTSDTISSSNFISGGDYINSSDIVVRNFDVAIPSNATYVAVVIRPNDSIRFAATLILQESVKEAVTTNVANEIKIGSEKLINSGGVAYSLLKKPNHISVSSDGSKDFLTIQDALNSITDATEFNRYQIDVYSDEIITHHSDMWDARAYEKITEHVGNNDYYCVGFITKNFVDIVGIGNVTVGVVLSRSEIEGLSGANIVPVHMRKNATLKNLHIVGQNVRYTIHTEVGTSGDNNGVKQVLEDCTVEFLGNPDAAYFSDQWSSGSPWGCGILSGQTCSFKNCKIIGGGCICHTSENCTQPANVLFEGCEWECYGNGITFNEYASRQFNSVIFVDCIMPPIITFRPSLRNNTVNAWTKTWNTEIRRCTPCAIDFNNWSNKNFLYNTEVHVMKFVTADEGSTIKVVGGTAKDLIYGENYVLSRKTTTKGYCAGTLLIGDNKNSQESYKFALGNRLGDCSVTNKTLIIEVTDSSGNTSQHTITFSNNYGGDSSVAPLISQSAILSEINNQLTGIAVCSVNIPQNFPYGDKYYLVRNKGSEKILAGMGVVFDYTLGVSSVRVATSEDGHIDGIALEDIPVYASYDKNMYHVIKCGEYLYKYQSGSPLIEDIHEAIQGKMYKIGSEDGKFVHTEDASEAVVVGLADYIFKLI